MADITMGAAYKEEIPQGTVQDYGTGLDCTVVKCLPASSMYRGKWVSVTLAGKSVTLEVDTDARCTKLNGEVETVAKDFAQMMTDISSAPSVAAVSSWLTTNFTDLHKGT